MAAVEGGGERRRVRRAHPRSAELLEWRVGAAADREVRPLDGANPWIDAGRHHVAHVGGWVDPRQARRFEPVVAPPLFHGHDGQIRANVRFAVQQPHELADRQSVTNRHRQIAYVPIAARVLRRPLDVDAVNRIGTIEHDNRQPPLRRFLEHIRDRRGICVEPRANVLQVGHDHVEPLEHLRRRPLGLSVQRVNRQSGFLVS